MGYVDNSQITPLYANTTPGVTADATVVDPAIAAMIVAINTNYDAFANFIAAIELPIPDQSIVTRHLRNLSVTNAKLAALAVTADKIADGSITLTKLADMVVTAQKIADGTITEAKMANSSVSRRMIQPGAVGANEIDPTILAPITDAAVQVKFNQIDEQLAETAANVKNYSPDGVDDSAAFNSAFAAYYKTILPQGEYRLSKFQGIANQQVDGMGSTLSLFYGASPVLVGFHDNSIYENIIFDNQETDLEWTRASLENRSNVIIRNCVFRGFRNPTHSNAWGLYLKNSKNILIENCRFSNNTQSDIAVLEGCESIVISNVQGENGEKVVLNIEPNTGTSPVNGVTVIGGHFETLYLLENDAKENSVQNVVIQSAVIDELVYDGAAVDFIGCTIKSMRNSPVSNFIFSGVANFHDSIVAGKNLLNDPRVVSLSRDSARTNWIIASATIAPSQRYRVLDDAELGRIVRLNPDSLSGTNRIKPISNIACSPGERYLFVLSGRAIYPSDAVHYSKHTMIRFYDSSSTLLSTHTVYGLRGNPGETTNYARETTLIVIPEGCVSFNIEIGSTNTSNNKLDISAVSLHKVLTIQDKGDTSAIDRAHYPITGPVSVVVGQIPETGVERYLLNMRVGDQLIIPPVAGAYEKYVCTAVPNTLKGAGLIEA